MQLGLLALANVPWTELIKAAPKVMDSAVKLYDSVSGRQRRRPPRDAAQTDDIPTLRADVTELQERLDALEGNDEAQAELIAQMSRHEAALLRWLMVLGLTSVGASAVAIVALVFAVLR